MFSFTKLNKFRKSSAKLFSLLRHAYLGARPTPMARQVGGITDLGEMGAILYDSEAKKVCHSLEARIGLRIDSYDELLSAMHRSFAQFPVFASGEHFKFRNSSVL